MAPCNPHPTPRMRIRVSDSPHWPVERIRAILGLHTSQASARPDLHARQPLTAHRLVEGALCRWLDRFAGCGRNVSSDQHQHDFLARRIYGRRQQPSQLTARLVPGGGSKAPTAASAAAQMTAINTRAARAMLAGLLRCAREISSLPAAEPLLTGSPLNQLRTET